MGGLCHQLRGLCHHFDDGSCRSCTLLSEPYAAQLAAKDAAVKAALEPFINGNPATFPEWLPPVASPQFGFRNKAKMVVKGTIEHPILGLPPKQTHSSIIDNATDVDLSDCPLHHPEITAAFPAIKEFITTAQLQPYDLSATGEKVKGSKAAARGELKNVIVTASPQGELLVQFVLRSRATEARIRSKLPLLLATLPNLKVVSLNIHPEHKAVATGETEIVLTEQHTLPFKFEHPNGMTLQVGPQSFFQTNTYIAGLLYQQARNWLAPLPISKIWDLYCGIGGFALSLAAPGRSVIGVEIAPDAIEYANAAAASLLRCRDEITPASGIIDFQVGDATRFAIESPPHARPDALVVNPPRRGLGSELVDWVNNSNVPTVLYSSCNPATLAKDIAALIGNYRIAEVQVFDMFPNTTHCEVLTLLTSRVH